ncbi:MAG TPA: hypothetical protein VHZ98_04215 [Galbitalea sp.]|nr:hypothetical protein [Galbitalea sp.]
MTFYTSPTPASSPPAAPKPVSFVSRPLVKLVAYLVSWFVFSLSFALLGYSVIGVMSVGGTCASGNTPYVIATQCPESATVFLPWVIFTGLIAVGIAVVLANGIGIQLRVWAWPILFGVLGGLFLLAGQVVGYLLGAMFIIMALVPLVIELRASIQRVFLGSFNIFGQQFKEGPKAQPSFSSRKMPNPPDAVKPGIGDWAIDILGFIVPAVAGLYVATVWVAALAASNG